jgi:L-aspartate oxidase
VHVNDATGWAVQQALEAAARDNPNITLVPDMVAIDLIVGRHQERFSTSGRVHGIYALNRKYGQGRGVHRARDHIRDRGGRAHLSLFHGTAWRDWRWHRDGMAREDAACRTWK